MVKVLIYSSKELYDNSSFEGRAEANVIAYREGDEYIIIKNRTSQYMSDRVSDFSMSRMLEWAERDEWNFEMDRHKTKERYKEHPLIELMKNDT